MTQEYSELDDAVHPQQTDMDMYLSCPNRMSEARILQQAEEQGV